MVVSHAANKIGWVTATSELFAHTTTPKNACKKL